MNALDTLGVLRKGAFAESFQTELRHLVDAVRDTGKKGSITVTLTIEPAGKGEEVALSIADKITVKLPSPQTGTTLMYATADGDLSRRDPRQHDVEDHIREVRAAS